MLILGVILVLLGWLTGIGILTTLGIILLVIGAVLWILGSMDARSAAAATGGDLTRLPQPEVPPRSWSH